MVDVEITLRSYWEQWGALSRVPGLSDRRARFQDAKAVGQRGDIPSDPDLCRYTSEEALADSHWGF
jgi:hypothetical protein